MKTNDLNTHAPRWGILSGILSAIVSSALFTALFTSLWASSVADVGQHHTELSNTGLAVGRYVDALIRELWADEQSGYKDGHPHPPESVVFSRQTAYYAVVEAEVQTPDDAELRSCISGMLESGYRLYDLSSNADQAEKANSMMESYATRVMYQIERLNDADGPWRELFHDYSVTHRNSCPATKP